jgi:hypothetical protein
MNVKLAEYTQIPTLEGYIVASQDEPILWVWQRDADSRAFPATPAEITGREATLVLDATALSVPLAEIYRGISTS